MCIWHDNSLRLGSFPLREHDIRALCNFTLDSTLRTRVALSPNSRKQKAREREREIWWVTQYRDEAHSLSFVPSDRDR